MGRAKNNMSVNKRLYYIWHNMISRCSKESHKAYKNYGGRGIRVCEDWKTMQTFIDWSLSNGYSDNLTIDRKDVNGNYEPDNCKWSTMKEQSNNKRNNVFISIGDETRTISEWAEEVGIKGTSFSRRHKIENFDDVLRSPRIMKDYKLETILIKDELKTLEELSKEYDIKLRTLVTRYIRGYRDETIIKKVQNRRDNTKINFVNQFITYIENLEKGKHKKRDVYTFLEVSNTAFTKYILEENIQNLIKDKVIEISNRYIVKL